MMFMCPLFRLLQTCERHLNNGSLGGIDALLGAPLQLFHKSHLKEFRQLDTAEQNLIASSMFYAINWLRELMNAFANQEGTEMEE